ncbi:uncharacterized protein LOC109715226 isoform X2 [Ananas comosus]|uniref:Uncharacterized protein LOC109715226 isoform X2 n=1 Tax=Ananas comosus TaxID=4615 RepID=A0A6P5FHE0_ANACO|nr:uncharacterized protein LOC109715226 isoform X2 [Ananas comosus]
MKLSYQEIRFTAQVERYPAAKRIKLSKPNWRSMAARSCNSMISRLVPDPLMLPHLPNTRSSLSFSSQSCSETRATALPSNRVEAPHKNPKKASRSPRKLISVPTSGGRWQDKWCSEFAFTMGELQLVDLLDEDKEKDAEVFVSLSVQKHTGFGFSIDGRIVTSFSRKCSCCFSSYCRKIDAPFNVWVLPSSKNSELEMPEIGGNDPSVIYVKPGSEVDLDSLIKDTIRLTASAEDTCSESCAKSAVVWQYTDRNRGFDQRWSRLLELKNALRS